MKNKLAIITTHPIQYNAPLFKLMAERQKIKIKVFYTWEQSKEKVWDEKFGREIDWDIPLLDGYDYTFVKNVAKNPNSAEFNGVVNPTLIDEIKQWKATAILVFGWKHNSHFKAMRYFKNKIPVYFRGDSNLVDEKAGFKTFLRRMVLKFVYHFVDTAFYVGTHNKNYFLKHGLKDKQLVFAPHAIDNERFMSEEFEQKAIDWRKKLNINDKRIVFLFVGKFEQKKDPLILVEAARKLPDYDFLFVGNGVLEKEIFDNAGENCHFLDFQNQSLMPAVYRLGDVVVLPSKGPGETWGLAINEAMACKKPVLVSDKTGCAVDLVKDGLNGYVFKAGNINDLVEKIKLFENNLQSLGNESFRLIKKWSFEEIAKTIEKV